jgi:hypothetical protein
MSESQVYRLLYSVLQLARETQRDGETFEEALERALLQCIERASLREADLG